MSAILAEIPPNLNLADIGADHGYIGINYATNNPNNVVVGSDISKMSIQKAENTAKQLGLTNYITRVGDGLAPINDLPVDVVLISGMGGEEIINILSGSKSYSMYVLSPQKNADKVRFFLSKAGYVPTKDYKVLSEGKFYDVIVAIKGDYNPSESELFFGSGAGADFLLFAEHTKQYYNNLLNVVGNNQEKQNIEHKICLLDKMLEKRMD